MYVLKSRPSSQSAFFIDGLDEFDESYPEDYLPDSRSTEEGEGYAGPSEREMQQIIEAGDVSARRHVVIEQE